MSFPRYREYKDSGIAWIGEVPVGWQVWKIGHSFGGFGSGTTPPTSDEKWFSQGEIPWVTTGELREKIVVSTKKNLVGEALKAFPALQVHPRGSLVIAMYGATIGRLGVLGVPATTNQACCVLSEPMSLDVRFTFYWLLVHREQIVSLFSSGGGQPNINRETITSLKVPAPNLNEQTQIARFLDHETAKIDALIREQERLIELLQEKRQAVISHAVTKGLDPDVPMKDSGVEWLEEVPAHWRVVPFGYAISYQEGPGIMASDFRDEGVPLLRVSGVQGRWASLKGCNYLDPKKVKKRWKHFQLNHGDLLISASASMGTVCEVDNATVGAVPYTGLIRLTPIAKISHRDFVRAIVGSQQFAVQIDLFKAGSTIQHFGPTHLSQMKVALPPLEEQIQLAEHVDKVTTEFKSLIEEAEKGNKLLKERRTALISAAVTGKIDVRNWQPPQDESAFDEEVRKAGMEATA
ncbi:restriction endonuclease subunit S [Marinobacter goseongensis]|uniref:restriction endonuclease subunit S n=1 Tax=Marinobacter goseongensis TaxID=453838 RepID=UPI002005981C|nr:restriction endonuclease subunit S [Marinobacter goseongensis]